jgi:hypothetical protein
VLDAITPACQEHNKGTRASHGTGVLLPTSRTSHKPQGQVLPSANLRLRQPVLSTVCGERAHQCRVTDNLRGATEYEECRARSDDRGHIAQRRCERNRLERPHQTIHRVALALWRRDGKRADSRSRAEAEIALPQG